MNLLNNYKPLVLQCFPHPKIEETLCNNALKYCKTLFIHKDFLFLQVYKCI